MAENSTEMGEDRKKRKLQSCPPTTEGKKIKKTSSDWKCDQKYNKSWIKHCSTHPRKYIPRSQSRTERYNRSIRNRRSSSSDSNSSSRKSRSRTLRRNRSTRTRSSSSSDSNPSSQWKSRHKRSVSARKCSSSGSNLSLLRSNVRTRRHERSSRKRIQCSRKFSSSSSQQNESIKISSRTSLSPDKPKSMLTTGSVSIAATISSFPWLEEDPENMPELAATPPKPSSTISEVERACFGAQLPRDFGPKISRRMKSTFFKNKSHHSSRVPGASGEMESSSECSISSIPAPRILNSLHFIKKDREDMGHPVISRKLFPQLEGERSCPICFTYFKSLEMANDHYRFIHKNRTFHAGTFNMCFADIQNSLYYFLCKIPNLNLTRNASLLLELLEYPEDRFQCGFECQTCNDLFNDSICVELHARECHDPVILPFCRFCDQKFHTRARLINHLSSNSKCFPSEKILKAIQTTFEANSYDLNNLIIPPPPPIDLLKSSPSHSGLETLAQPSPSCDPPTPTTFDNVGLSISPAAGPSRNFDLKVSNSFFEEEKELFNCYEGDSSSSGLLFSIPENFKPIQTISQEKISEVELFHSDMKLGTNEDNFIQSNLTNEGSLVNCSKILKYDEPEMHGKKILFNKKYTENWGEYKDKSKENYIPESAPKMRKLIPLYMANIYTYNTKENPYLC